MDIYVPSFGLDLYFPRLCKPMFTILRNIPMIFYYTTALTKHETNQVERKGNLLKLSREDSGPDVKNV